MTGETLATVRGGRALGAEPAAPWGAWESLASVQTFLWLAALLLLGCVLGTLLPQGEPAVLHARLGPAAAAAAERLGLGDVFHSPWFNGLLAALALNLAACSARRIRAARSRPGVFLVHGAVLLVLAGALTRWIRGQRGIVELRQGTEADSLRSDSGAPGALPFRVRLDRFAVEYWEEPAHYVQVRIPVLGADRVLPIRVGSPVSLGDGAQIEALSFLPNFVLGPDGPATRDQEPANPALHLAYRRSGKESRFWVFARFPDMHAGRDAELRALYQFVPGRIRQFRSEITLLGPGGGERRGTLEVNRPLSHAGYTLYQYGFDRGDPSRATLLAVRDPGVPLVYAGFALLGLGLLVNFRWRRFP